MHTVNKIQEEIYMGYFIVKILDTVDHFLTVIANYFYEEG